MGFTRVAEHIKLNGESRRRPVRHMPTDERRRHVERLGHLSEWDGEGSTADVPAG